MTVREPITAENVLRLFGEQVNTTVIGTRRSEAADAELAGYDEEQIRLMDEVCIVLDEDDQPIGSASKKTCMHGMHKAYY
jgi:isopentenyl-diphosphate delta-isomerase